MNVQRAPSVEPRGHWFHLVRLGCCDARIYPHNPKVAGSNSAPATMNDEGLADATAANPFRLPRLHPGIDSALGGTGVACPVLRRVFACRVSDAAAGGCSRRTTRPAAPGRFRRPSWFPIAGGPLPCGVVAVHLHDSLGHERESRLKGQLARGCVDRVAQRGGRSRRAGSPIPPGASLFRTRCTSIRGPHSFR